MVQDRKKEVNRQKIMVQEHSVFASEINKNTEIHGKVKKVSNFTQWKTMYLFGTQIIEN